MCINFLFYVVGFLAFIGEPRWTLSIRRSCIALSFIHLSYKMIWFSFLLLVLANSLQQSSLSRYQSNKVFLEISVFPFLLLFAIALLLLHPFPYILKIDLLSFFNFHLFNFLLQSSFRFYCNLYSMF